MLNDVPPDSIAVTQETFGPIAPVVGIGSLEDAIEQTNAQTYGLMAAIFTADLAAGMRYADSVAMGLVNINETTNYWEPHLPVGRPRAVAEWDRPRGRALPDGHPHGAPDSPNQGLISGLARAARPDISSRRERLARLWRRGDPGSTTGH